RRRRDHLQRHHRTQAAAEAVNEARIYAEAIVGTVRQPLLVLNAELHVQSANAAFYELFRVAAKDTLGSLLYGLGNGQWDIPALRTLLDEVLSKNQEVTDYEVEHEFRDIGRRSMLLNARKLSQAAGREELILLAIEDITERRQSERHRKTLMSELNHRVKNTLAVVQSIASQTLGHASTLDEAREAFGARLINLANAQNILTRENWQSADLGDIVSDTVKPHAGGENRFRIEGPPVRLAPGAALAVSMALHELTTNAAKYG
ncbi:PAS domain-containing protein, partial [Mesorhizobium sp. M4B.F.Ca.ET.089.01.1.1]|uniref:HWE histidine kinase domain-containing protein n=1 Tax=Mesorhizobium sp. M4B.F.Ca.ET.089.01.1.1 TaxID=2496662 RepID=UPI000FE3B584